MFEENNNENRVELPFSEDAQLGLLGHLIQNEKFFSYCRNTIEPGWFINLYAAKVLKSKLDFFAEFKRVPSLAELKIYKNIQLEENSIKGKILNTISISIIKAQDFQLDYLEPQLTAWLHGRLFHTGIQTAVKKYNEKKPSEAFSIARQMVKTIDQTTFAADKEMDFTDFVNVLSKRESERRGALTFGSSVIDRVLLPPLPCERCAGSGLTAETGSCIACAGTGCVGSGSLLKGDMTVLMAPVNIGKSTCLITVGMHNVRQFKDVLFISHEGTPADLYEKFWCSLMGIDKNNLYKLYRTEEGRAKMSQFLPLLTEHFCYLPMNKPGLTVEEVEGVISRKFDQKASQNGGKGYDLVICDYPAKTTTAQAKGGQFALRNIQSWVYNYWTQMALFFDCHALVAIQTNREGSKVNSGFDGREKRLTRMEDVSETWGAMETATNVITLNRDADAEENDRMTLNSCKSRSNKKNIAVLCKSKFGCSVSHSEQLGAVSYRGDEQLSDSPDRKVDDLLKNWQAHPVLSFDQMREFTSAA